MRPRLARFALGHSLQLSLDGFRTGKYLPVQFIKSVIRCVKNEAPWDTGRDPDRTAIELDCKSLGNHRTLLPARSRSPDTTAHPSEAARLIEMWKRRSLERCAALWEP